MLRLIICGINGAMGNTAYNLAIKRGHNVVCGIDKVTVGKTECPVYKDFDQINEHADVIIDFSSPSALDGLLSYALTNKTPLVLCATGYSTEQEYSIAQASKNIPIFKSPNTSVGIRLFSHLCQILTENAKGFDIEIIEKHHKNKKDSPSGTAKLLSDCIAKAQNKANMSEQSQKTTSKTAIHSIRGGSVVGEHSVVFLGEYESFTLTHTAHSKELFAKGAIDACEFIMNSHNGLYGMSDLSL